MTRRAPETAAVARKRLDRETILANAEAIVDRLGWPKLTMSELARELDVRVPSLYNHVPNLEGLLGDLQIRAMSQLANELGRAAMGKVGATGFRALASVLRDYARRHPGRYELAMREPLDVERLQVASADAAEALIAVITSFGVVDPSQELMLTCFGAIHGVVTLEVGGLYSGVVDTDPVFERAVDLVVLLLENEASEEALAS